MNKDRFKCLIIEDDPVWRRILFESLKFRGGRVDMVATFANARLKIAKNRYDLVLLDVGLDQPTINATCQDFWKYLGSQSIRDQIIAISGRTLTMTEVELLHRHFVPRGFIDKSRTSRFECTRLAKRVLAAPLQKARERLADTPSGSEPVIALITVNEHETCALYDAFLGKSQVPTPHTRKGITYGDMGVHGGIRVIHTICEMGTSGVGAAQERARAAIVEWRPRAVIAVGIAFGMDKRKQQIGDVLISGQLQDYELGRVNDSGTLTPRGDKPSSSDHLKNRFRYADATLRRTIYGWPKVQIGLLLSGQKLVDNLDYRNSLKKQYSEAIGGEMEGIGLYVTAVAARVDWIVVKSICDWGYNKNGSMKTAWQKRAARNAAMVLKAAIDLGALYDRKRVRI